MAKRTKAQVDAAAIVKLLANKHGGDVFIPECKDGPTHGANHLRLDAWAMKRSWSNPCTTGYEIKVSRSDFLKDDKWSGYLETCNQFYFVCPPGVIRVDELPEPAGLLEVASTGSRLFTRRKAPYREGDPPVSLLYYALMRAKGFERYPTKQANQAEFWREWLENRRLDYDLGRRVSRCLRDTIRERITRAELQNEALQHENDRYAEIKVMLDAHGLSASQWGVADTLRERLSGGVPRELRRSIDRLIEVAEKAKAEFDKVLEPCK